MISIIRDYTKQPDTRHMQFTKFRLSSTIQNRGELPLLHITSVAIIMTVVYNISCQYITLHIITSTTSKHQNTRPSAAARAPNSPTPGFSTIEAPPNGGALVVTAFGDSLPVIEPVVPSPADPVGPLVGTGDAVVAGMSDSQPNSKKS
jgi:hypothetical protein